jgi:hypothetical protein
MIIWVMNEQNLQRKTLVQSKWQERSGIIVIHGRIQRISRCLMCQVSFRPGDSSGPQP